MEEDLARTDYPALLANLQPNQAVQLLNDRVRRINKINIEIADWLQERRRVEEQYVLGLRKLSQLKTPNSQSDLGVFQAPWARIIEAVDSIASSHHQLAERVERDVEMPLRAFQQRSDVINISSISGNLSTLAKDLEDARSQSEKLNKKGGKASSQKVDAAASKLESATQQWESQAPFVFENLQALDESRVNQLRDLLTQYQTHESEQAQRAQQTAVETLAAQLEISTEAEIQEFAQKINASRPAFATRSSTRQSTSTAPGGADSIPAPTTLPRTNTSNSQAPPPTPPQPQPAAEETKSEKVPQEEPKQGKLRRLGTILGGRRRQSVHGGIGLSPQKNSSYGRVGSTRPGISPRASSSNLHESNRMSTLAEAPDMPPPPTQGSMASSTDKQGHENTNGHARSAAPVAAVATTAGTITGVNGTHDVDVSDVPPPPGPPPGQQDATLPSKDLEGFTIPAPMNDPISEAQREAAGADDADQLFKLNIQNKPVEEEDPQAKEAALSSVANTLKMGPATRRTGTIRGRRDVRNTMYVPSPNVSDGQNDTASPIAAALGATPGLASPTGPLSRTGTGNLSALASETNIATMSDNQSIRSGYSLGSLAQVKHAEMAEPGINSSIIETVSAVFENGTVTSVSIAGEIAFINNITEEGSTKETETIRINNFPALERIGPNRIFVQNASPDQPDRFNLDVSHLAKMSTAFSYRVFTDDSGADPLTLAKHAPLLLKPVWKPQGDKLGLLLQYQLNPSSALAQPGSPVTLHNVVLLAAYKGRASGAQTKPSGTHLKDKHLVYWRLGDVTLTSEAQRIVCRIVGADASEPPTEGHVEARWEYVATGDAAIGSGISISRLVEDTKGKGKEVALDDDPFTDSPDDASSSEKWADVPLARKLVAGKYEGH